MISLFKKGISKQERDMVRALIARFLFLANLIDSKIQKKDCETKTVLKTLFLERIK